jgi:hypothetical protein
MMTLNRTKIFQSSDVMVSTPVLHWIVKGIKDIISLVVPTSPKDFKYSRSFIQESKHWKHPHNTIILK